jgi:GxxExxY protein
MDLADEELTHTSIGGFHRVYNDLGFGFAESGYVGALVYELGKRGLRVRREVPVPLYYDGVIVATYRIDILVEDRLIIEVKSCAALRPEHSTQVFNYLRCTDVELALLFNFGNKPDVKRYTLRNGVKKLLRKPESES